MDIMYFEDVEVGKKENKSVTYQVKKRSSNSLAIGILALFILTKWRQFRQFLEDSLPVQLIYFPFSRGLPHMVKGVPRR
jgi:hypothetical protein